MAFLPGLAAAVVVGRLALGDTRFLDLEALPGHDLYQAAPLVAAHLHSIRTTGDLAWWCPTPDGGYPLHFVSLLSPLAPTLGHVTFIAWMQLVRALAWFGVALAEYRQYVVFTYVVAPFIATLAFAWWCTLFLRSRAAVALATIGMSFSGFGLWMSAWFYFQETATAFLLMGAGLRAVRRPGRAATYILLAAILVQLASANYWTIFNSWFVVAVVGVYLLSHRGETRDAMARLWSRVTTSRGRAAALTIPVLAVGTLWMAIATSTLRTEGPLHQRALRQEFGSAWAAPALVAPPLSLHAQLLFAPHVNAPAGGARSWETMHRAGYVGLPLVPLLLGLTLFRPRAVEIWLLGVLASLTVISAGPRALVALWEVVPFMDSVRHVFRFYPAYLRLIVIVIAAVGLDRLLREQPGSTAVHRAMIRAIAVIPPVFYGLLTFDGYGFVLLAASCVAASWALGHASPRSRRIAAAVIVMILTVDLGRYFHDVSRRDATFTAERWKVARPLPQEIRHALGRPWDVSPRLDALERVFAQMPVANFFWPVNGYVPNPAVRKARRLANDTSQTVFSPPLAFHRDTTLAADGTRLEGTPEPLRYEWLRADYNGWAISFDAPRDGWLSVAQIQEPGWNARLDDEPIAMVNANFVRTAVRVPAGAHRLEMTYRPVVRALYWPACWMLEVVLVSLLWLAWKARDDVPLTDAGSP